jgi:endonuclease/exonuclease/phosphatase family metal-dependent hydrolase
MNHPYNTSITRGFYLALAVSLLAGTHVLAESGTRLRVLTYNIHHGEGLDGKLDLERIANVIRTAAPDLVSLQEVDNRTKRTNGVDQAATLAQLTGLHVIFGKNIELEGGEYGNAILSKLPPTLDKNLKLPSVAEIEPLDEVEQRGALAIKVVTPGGERIVFIATHLDHRRGDKERLASAELINQEFTGASDQLPTVLAGDLNATRESTVLKTLMPKWHVAGSEEIATVPAGRPRRQIDYVLIRPKARWRIIEVNVLDEPVASDHRPVLAVLELVPPGSAAQSPSK